MGKGQRASDLMGIHSAGGSIESLHSRGIRLIVAQRIQSLLNAWPAPMSFADFDLNQFPTLMVFHHLDMS
jgi:hypothetical protein